MIGKPAQPLALTMGEPAGVGPELTLRAWLAADRAAMRPFFFLGDERLLRTTAASLNLNVDVAAIDHPHDAPGLFCSALPVLPLPLGGPVNAGAPDAGNAAATIRSIEKAARLCLSGEACGMVTNPIHKSTLYEAGFRAPGHTEYLAALCREENLPANPVMMLVADDFRTVPVTVHLPLKAVPEHLSVALVTRAARQVAACLSEHFAVPSPRLAIAGLNPHAGEAGAMGREDETIVARAVADLRAAGIAATGPHPADSMFHAGARKTYDAAICMYHDQALIPIKTIAFERAVNVTIGLPFIRTSPDHGSALDIAGSGKADPCSLVNALLLASSMAGGSEKNDMRTGAA